MAMVAGWRLHVYMNLKLLNQRWQTQGPWAESGPPPCFTQPSTLFLPGGSTKLLAPS